MKYPITILFFTLSIIGFSESLQAQRGFRLIEKAEKEVESTRYRKALKLLKKAEKEDYGICGNAGLTAQFEIDSLKFIVFYQLIDYEAARKSLDSLLSFGKRDDLDSLKIITYQAECGNEILKQTIDTSLSGAYVECSEYDCYGNIPIEKTEKIIRLKIHGDYFKYMFVEDNTERNNLWIDEFRESEAYKLIKQEI